MRRLNYTDKIHKSLHSFPWPGYAKPLSQNIQIAKKIKQKHEPLVLQLHISVVLKITTSQFFTSGIST